MPDNLDHKPTVWTARKLREAIAHLPEDAPIHIGIADSPGDFDGYHDYVLVDAEHVISHWPATSTSPERSETEKGIHLFGDYPEGRYARAE
ncbi:DUF6225 family protein [Streptomyces sp. LUP47B]|uniref:DUF6225 family protein n=1 Tax=Streptomyces sp. LUP47B TaxID=1890286 RepID=UPI000851865E|nr:DUF6225 family protein [Streptomyces sp. LUP47B]